MNVDQEVLYNIGNYLIKFLRKKDFSVFCDFLKFVYSRIIENDFMPLKCLKVHS